MITANRKTRRATRPPHQNSKAGNKQIIGNKVIKHLPAKSLGERKKNTPAEKILLEIVKVRGWYIGTEIKRCNAHNIKRNLREGVISKDRVQNTLTALGYKNTGVENWVKL